MRGPLDGIVVLDMTRALAGPHATMMLGDLGARVIKIEHPGTGDESRHWGPPFAAADSTYFLSCNRNKESVTCDLRADEGKDLLRRLAARCDVLVENFRPGVLDRLGFSCERLHELNPRLVICSITGFGHDGPEGARPGYDQIVQGEAGLMSVTGMDADHPVKAGLSIADVLAGVHAALGIVTALHERTATGLGRVVRTSLLASIVGAHAFQGTRWTVAREIPVATGNHHPSIVPYGAFRCADGMIQVAVANEGQWRRFAPVVGIDPADGRFAENQLRVARRAELITEIERALAGRGTDVGDCCTGRMGAAPRPGATDAGAVAGAGVDAIGVRRPRRGPYRRLGRHRHRRAQRARADRAARRARREPARHELSRTPAELFGRARAARAEGAVSR